MSTIDAVNEVDSDLIICLSILRGASYESAAQSAGCSRSTVTRRMGDAQFRARLNELRTQVFARTADFLVAESIESVHKLSEIRSSPDVSPALQLRAACAILDASLKYRMAVDLEDRVAALESVLRARQT